jgi:hypothetical protein
MLFGTFRNPRALENTACGFYQGASGRLIDLLIGRDVSTPATRGHGTRPAPQGELGRARIST